MQNGEEHRHACHVYTNVAGTGATQRRCRPFGHPCARLTLLALITMFSAYALLGRLFAVIGIILGGLIVLWPGMTALVWLYFTAAPLMLHVESSPCRRCSRFGQLFVWVERPHM